MKNFLIATTFIFTLGLISSCDFSYFENDIADFSFNDVELKAPIGYLEYTLTELLEKLEIEEIKTKNDGTLLFSTTTTIEEDNNEAYEVPIIDHTFRNTINTSITSNILPVSFPYTLKSGDIPILPTTPIEMQFKQDLSLSKNLTSASFSSGSLVLSIESTFNSDTNITVTIPSFIKKSDNSIYSKTVNLKGAEKAEIEVSLADYNANFTHNGTEFNENTSNNVVINTLANISFQEGDIINTTDKVIYEVRLLDIKTEVIHCDFEKEPFFFNESLSLDIDGYKKYADNIDFINSDAELSLTVKNGFGFPIGVELTGIEADNEIDTPINLSYTSILPEEIAIGNKFIINGLTSYTNNSQDFMTTELTLNKNNSNIKDFIELKPKTVNLVLSGHANPIDSSPNKNFFSINNAGLTVDITLTVPLSAKVTDMNIQLDPEQFDLGEEIDNFKKIDLLVTTENQIPLSGKINMFFLNNGVSIGLQKELNLFEAAPTDSNGVSNGSTTEITNLLLTSEELELLEEANEVQLDIIFNSAENANSVLLKGDDTIRVGIATNVTINGSEINKN